MFLPVTVIVVGPRTPYFPPAAGFHHTCLHGKRSKQRQRLVFRVNALLLRLIAVVSEIEHKLTRIVMRHAKAIHATRLRPFHHRVSLPTVAGQVGGHVMMNFVIRHAVEETVTPVKDVPGDFPYAQTFNTCFTKNTQYLAVVVHIL